MKVIPSTIAGKFDIVDDHGRLINFDAPFNSQQEAEAWLNERWHDHTALFIPAGDSRIRIRGEAPKVACRILSEENYQKAMKMVNNWLAIETLRQCEADSVTINCDNPEGPPNAAIDCVGGWTDYEERRFMGDTVQECLEHAVAAYRHWEKQQ